MSLHSGYFFPISIPFFFQSAASSFLRCHSLSFSDRSAMWFWGKYPDRFYLLLFDSLPEQSQSTCTWNPFQGISMGGCTLGACLMCCSWWWMLTWWDQTKASPKPVLWNANSMHGASSYWFPCPTDAPLLANVATAWESQSPQQAWSHCVKGSGDTVTDRGTIKFIRAENS